MPPEGLTPLIEKAKKVLAGNWAGRFTKPSPHLYPHQWNWDSGFIALGYARSAPNRPQSEPATRFQAHGANGLLPPIVFNPPA